MENATVERKQDDRDLMEERGYITLNGHTFKVTPVFLGEEEEYLNDLQVTPYPKKKDEELSIEKIDEIDVSTLNTFVMSLFSKSRTVGLGSRGGFRKFIECFLKKLGFKRYYYANSTAYTNIKWLQKKVYYNGKRVNFYDLERKFSLNKSEIERLFIEIHFVSGF